MITQEAINFRLPYAMAMLQPHYILQTTHAAQVTAEFFAPANTAERLKTENMCSCLVVEKKGTFSFSPL